MTEPYVRLREMRERAGFTSSSAAARALKVPVSTYGQYESGMRRFTVTQFERYEVFFQSVRLLRHFQRAGKGIPDSDVLAALVYDHIHEARHWSDADDRSRRPYISGLHAAALAAGISLAETPPKPVQGAPEAV